MNSLASKILIVDDYSNWREFLTRLLEGDGYSVTTVSNRDDALLIFEKEDIDAVILDVRLVDNQKYNLQGIELIKLIKTRNPNTVVVVLTGYPNKGQEEIVLNFYKADAYLSKVNVNEYPIESISVDNFCLMVSSLISKSKSV